jgi:pSer/pThr/pTyr-binding forkhead associated (FHA) protein
MIVTLVFTEGIHTITLPDKILGQFWLHDSLSPTPDNQLIAVEGVDDKWVLKSNKKVTVRDEGDQPVSSLTLKPLKLYSLTKQTGTTSRQMRIFTESITTSRQQYNKYWAAGLSVINIGRGESNDIFLDNPYVSWHHARLTRVPSSEGTVQWRLEDMASHNGAYVNSQQVSDIILSNGDTISIAAGSKIIISGNIIAVNNPGGQTHINTNTLKPVEEILRLDPIDDADKGEDTDDFDPDAYFESFQRSPRFTQPLPKRTFKAEAPPENQIGQEVPFLFTLGPAITMGLGSVTMMLFSVNNAMNNGNIAAATPSIAMATSMLAGVVLWPILSKRFDNPSPEFQAKIAELEANLLAPVKLSLGNLDDFDHQQYDVEFARGHRISRIAVSPFTRTPRDQVSNMQVLVVDSMYQKPVGPIEGPVLAFGETLQSKAIGMIPGKIGGNLPIADVIKFSMNLADIYAENNEKQIFNTRIENFKDKDRSRSLVDSLAMASVLSKLDLGNAP